MVPPFGASSALFGATARSMVRAFRWSARRLMGCCWQHAARAGVEVREGVRVVDLLWDGNSVVGVRTAAEGELRDIDARLVVGADGLRSVVARRMGGVQQRGPQRIALVSYYEGIAGLGRMRRDAVGPRPLSGAWSATQWKNECGTGGTCRDAQPGW